MEVNQIKNIEDLILLPPGKTILRHEVKRLTAPGENYGSLMLSVDLTVENQTTTEKIYSVAKMVPPNEFVQKVFNTQVTFRNEIAFYKNIVPLLQDFQRENGVHQVIDFAAKFYGGRLNLSGGDEVDTNGALVLENLKIAQYETLERTECLGLEAAKLVIMNLAQFHAAPLALKLRKPEVFDKEIRPYLSPWKMDTAMHDSMKRNIEKVIDMIDGIKHLKDRILAGMDKQLEKHEIREPFATIVHNDCWSNNNMFKLEGGIPVKSILVDFQVLDYGSPAADVVFFIFSSVKNEVIAENYDELIQLYYNTFKRILEELKCDTSKFTFDALLKEIGFEAIHSQFAHSLFMLVPIHAQKENVQDVSEFSPDAMDVKEISNMHKQKFEFIVNEFAKRNWI